MNSGYVFRFPVLLLLSVFALSVNCIHAQQEQVDTLTKSEQSKGGAVPDGLSLRVRLVKATKAPEEITVQFRRGLYWKRAGGLGKVRLGQWTPWKDCSAFFSGKGASDFLIVEFPGCFGFEAEYQLAWNGTIVGTITETGEQAFSCILLPRWLMRKGVTPDKDSFKSGFQSLTSFNQGRLEHLKALFKGWDTLPKRYAFECGYKGFVSAETTGRPIKVSGRQSSSEAVKADFGIMHQLGINGLVGEDNLVLAERFGMRSLFNRHITFSHAQNPWYKIPCPFDPRLEKKRQAMMAKCRERIEKLADVGQVWNHWGDEIGVICKADHFSTCETCAEAFRQRSKGMGLTPGDFGQQDWAGVKPYADWKEGMPRGGSWPTDTPEQARNLYYSMRFMNWTTARFYEPVSKEMRKAGVWISPLRGPTPTWNGHSLDFFNFYDITPDTAVTWETSNRDPRVWQWCSYLAAISQSISRRNDVPVHVYIKPHRGAPTQRLLATASRGAQSFNWYNYGPPYAQGDEFTGPDQEHLVDEVARAVRILGAAEEITYDAARRQPRHDVALIYPRTTFDLRRGYGSTNHFQDAKWVYLALLHSHIPVDVIGETMIEDGDLDGRKVLYVIGSHMRRKAQKRVLDWVRNGGILWTDLEGMSCDQANQPTAEGVALTGQKNVQLEHWGEAPGYKATSLKPLKISRDKSKGEMSIKWLQAKSGTEEDPTLQPAPSIGREILQEGQGVVLARFDDGKPAVIMCKVGKGRVYVVGTYAGLDYSETVRKESYDMGKDLSSDRRHLIDVAVLDNNVRRPAVASHPLVETALIHAGNQAALFLMNWNYHSEPYMGLSRKGLPEKKYRKVLAPAENVIVTLNGVKTIGRARSCGRSEVKIRRDSGQIEVALPKLNAGDIVILEDVKMR